jgi:predicted TIM-barrel fold metal-dependent hydrolase
MIIDFHTHVFPPKINQDRPRYIDRDPLFALLYSRPQAKLATAEELIDSMDKTGVEISVIINAGWTTNELCRETNDYILESIARYSKRLIGFCTVQPKSIDAAVAEIERCARAGARGIGEMRSDIQSFDLTDEEVMTPFVAALRKHKLILLTHASEPVGHDYRGKGAITPDVLYPFSTRYPDVPLVCAHWGGGLPFYALMPEVKQAMKNVYFDTAASPFLYSPQIYRRVADLVGADRILFGTDYPLLSPTRLLDEINTTDLSEAEKRLILSENARRLLGLGS